MFYYSNHYHTSASTLFVYGELRPGGALSGLVTGDTAYNVKHLSEGFWVPHLSIYDTGYGWPAAFYDPDPEARVRMEAFLLPGTRVSDVDKAEGNPFLFRRVNLSDVLGPEVMASIDIDWVVKASQHSEPLVLPPQVYLFSALPEPRKEWIHIRHGDWTAYRIARSESAQDPPEYHASDNYYDLLFTEVGDEPDHQI